MRIKKRVLTEIADRFEASLDYIEALDRVPYHIKRQACEEAAKAAFEYLVNQ